MDIPRHIGLMLAAPGEPVLDRVREVLAARRTDVLSFEHIYSNEQNGRGPLCGHVRRSYANSAGRPSV